MSRLSLIKTDGSTSARFELMDLNTDIEPATPMLRLPAWYKRVVRKALYPVQTIWALGWLARVLNRSYQSNDPACSRSRRLLEAKRALILAVRGNCVVSDNVEEACVWYTELLEWKIKKHWTQLFQPVMMNIAATPFGPSDDDISVAFCVLTAVISAFARKDLALVEIVDAMYNKSFFKDTDQDRSHATQLAFAVVGWISLLYCPALTPGREQFEIIGPSKSRDHPPQRSRNRRTPRCTSRTFTCYQQTFDNKDLPIHKFLRRFGEIVPLYDVGIHRESGTPLVISGRDDGWIDQSLVCFHTLAKVASIKVQWVDCVGLHLEFDSRTKVLKLFRFPSFCLIMIVIGDKSPLSEIFRDNSEALDKAGLELDETRHLYKEILLTYRLIFGQTRSSYQDFNKMNKNAGQGRNGKQQSGPPTDPALQIMCGQSWESDEAQLIYDEIDTDDPPHYSPVSDFPFFGDRLIHLQSYVCGRNFKALWYDRRDVSWWWTFWAVIIIGALTLFLGILQSVLQIAQVDLAVKQLEQGRQAPMYQ